MNPEVKFLPRKQEKRTKTRAFGQAREICSLIRLRFLVSLLVFRRSRISFHIVRISAHAFQERKQQSDGLVDFRVF